MKIEAADGKVSLSIEGSYTAEELSDVIQKIGAARAQIAADPVNPVGMKLHIAPGGAWYTEYSAFAGMHTLLLHGPLGWQGFGLSTADVALLSHLLAGQVANVIRGVAPGTDPAAHVNDKGGGKVH